MITEHPDFIMIISFLITAILVPLFKKEVAQFFKSWGIYLERSFKPGSDLIIIFPGTIKQYKITVIKAGKVWAREKNHRALLKETLL